MVDTPTVERLGRYRLLRRLGRGGMATVYHAVQEGPHGFENEVAVKVVHPELIEEHPFLLQNLIDEARIAARIRHPNVVRILDLVEDSNRFYMVMDYVDGVSMRQVLDASRQSRTRPPPGAVLEVLAAAARGLDAAHRLASPDGTSMGLVHRDVKPGNILVSHDGLVKVSDFGVALFGDRLTQETMTGQMKGTPAYMSPEQALGDPVDHRSDIFSLGLTLYTLLTTKLVHEAESAVRLAMKIAAEPLDDQAAELEALVPGLGAVFATSCAKIPEQRYADAGQLSAALDAVRATLRSPTSIAEMIAATGWQPQQMSIAHVEREGTPPIALASTPDLALSLADAPVPATGFEESIQLDPDDSLPLDNSWDPSAEDDDGEPTVAGAPAPIGGVHRLGPLPPDPDESLDEEPTVPEAAAPIEDLDSPVGPALGRVAPPREDEPTAGFPDAPAATEDPTARFPDGPVAAEDLRAEADAPRPDRAPPDDDPEVTPVAAFAPPRIDLDDGRVEIVIPDPASPHVDMVIPPRVPPAPYPGGPRGPLPSPLPPGPPPYVPPAPPMAEQTARPGGAGKVHQPVRDYRGRVVRNSPLQENTSITRGEKIGVAVAFALLLVAVGTIVTLNVLRPTPPDRDPRIVDAELPPGPERVAASAAPAAPEPAAAPPPADGSVKPAPTPEPAARAVGDVIEATGTAADAAPGELVPGAVVEHKSRTLDDRAREAAAQKKTASKKAADEAAPDASPTPAPPGTLIVNSYPYSQVFVDGVGIGTTPIRAWSLPAGRHEVKLVFPSAGDVEHVQQVDVKAGGKATVIKKLDPT